MVVNCTGVLAPTVLPFITAGFSILSFLVAVPGNFLIILAIYKDPNRELRNPFNLLVGNLACADLVVGLVVLPISSVLHIREGLLDLPLRAGVALGLSYFIACTASLLSLATLMVDRHIAVTYPIYYRSVLSLKRVFIASISIWIISTGLSLIYIKVGYINYAFVFANIAIVVTMLLLFSCFYIMREIRNRGPANAAKDDDNSSDNGEKERRKPKNRQQNRKLEVRLTRTFATVLMAYLLCYGPSCIVIYLLKFCATCNCVQIHWFRDSQFVFVLLNSCINPFIYSWRIKAFRNALKKILGFKQRSGNATTQIQLEVRSYDNSARETTSFSSLQPGGEENSSRPRLLSVQKL